MLCEEGLGLEDTQVGLLYTPLLRASAGGCSIARTENARTTTAQRHAEKTRAGDHTHLHTMGWRRRAQATPCQNHPYSFILSANPLMN